MKAPPRKWGRGNRQTEGIRVRSKEEIFWAHSHLPKAAGHDEAVKSEPVGREPKRGGRLIRNTVIAATLLNGLLVTSVILLIAMLVPGSLPTANGGDESTSDALATPSAYEPVEQGLAVAEDNRESEPPSAAEQSVAGLVPAQRDQPAATEATFNWSAAMIEEILATIEESNESSALLPPVDSASALSAAHPGTASSSILQKRPPTDQSALPDAEFPDRLVETSALAPEELRHGAQAPGASSAETGVRLIKPGEEAVATADSTSPIEPDRPATAATEPSGDGQITAGVDRQPADARPDELPESGAIADVEATAEQPSTGAITEQIEPNIATAGADVPPEVTRSAPVTAAVNMRAGPDLDAAVITVVSVGTEVGVIGCDGWCEVVFGGERGWINQSYVSDSFLNGNSGDVSRSGGTDAGASGGAGTNGNLGGGGITPGASADIGNSPDSSDGSPSVDTTAHAQFASEPGEAANLQIAAGTPLISADGAPIGTVRDFHTDTNGQTLVVVDLTDGLGVVVRSIRLRVEHVLAADQHARLKFTRAQLVRSLPTTIGRPGDAPSGSTSRGP